MRPHHYLLVLFVAVIGGFTGASLKSDNISATHIDGQPAYTRVMETKTIRCGYALWPPKAMVKDANTGKMTGIFPDIAEKMAAKMGLKIEWTEETGWSSFIEGLESNRYDAFCAPVFIDAKRGLHLSYTVPLIYTGVHFYARKDDHRFDTSLLALNSPNVTLATMDGELTATIANELFPKAKQVSIPQLGEFSQLFLAVATGKADGLFLEPSLAKDFAEKNPGKIRQVTKEPFSIFPSAFAMRLGEEKLQTIMNNALTEMVNDGTVDRIIEKYEPDRSIFLPVAKPYTYIEPQPLR